MLDVRTPIAAMFAAMGLMLALYGLSTPAEIYAVSLGYNLNLYWGIAMGLFGLGMFAWQKLEKPEPEALLEAPPAAEEREAS